MAEAKKFDLTGQAAPEVFRTLPEGTKVKMFNGSSGEVIANPQDGGFVLVRIDAHPKDPSKVGEEDYVFFNEVREAE